MYICNGYISWDGSHLRVALVARHPIIPPTPHFHILLSVVVYRINRKFAKLITWTRDLEHIEAYSCIN
jgi:hypothetical protein